MCDHTYNKGKNIIVPFCMDTDYFNVLCGYVT